MQAKAVTGTQATRTAGLLLAAIAVVTLGLLSLATPAKAAPVEIKFDNGRLTIGSLFDNRVILPATDTFPSEDLPTPQRTDIQLFGDVTGDQITIPSALNSGLQFPYMHLMHPLEPGLKIPVTMRLNSPGLSGTWDAATGAATLEGTIDLIVVTGTGTAFPLPDSLDDLGVPPLGLFARCRVNDLPVSFSTATKVPTKAQPFAEGFGKKGSLTTSWNELPDAASENGGDCTQLNTLMKVPGGIWLSNGIVEPDPQDKPVETCETNVSLCPPPIYTEIDDVRLRPGRRNVRAGKKAMLTVRVHNSGNGPARNLKVRIRSTNKRVKVPKTVTMTVPAGKAATKRFPVRVHGRAKGRAVIIAANNGWSGRSNLKIVPRKSRKR